MATYPMAAWFETRGVAALLTMRVEDLILRSIAKRCVSKDEATGLQNTLVFVPISADPRQIVCLAELHVIDAELRQRPTVAGPQQLFHQIGALLSQGRKSAVFDGLQYEDIVARTVAIGTRKSFDEDAFAGPCDDGAGRILQSGQRAGAVPRIDPAAQRGCSGLKTCEGRPNMGPLRSV